MSDSTNANIPSTDEYEKPRSYESSRDRRTAYSVISVGTTAPVRFQFTSNAPEMVQVVFDTGEAERIGRVTDLNRRLRANRDG